MEINVREKTVSHATSIAMLASIVFTFFGTPLRAATVFQADIRVGMTDLRYAGFAGEEEFDVTLTELLAKIKIGVVSERNYATLVPMVRLTEFSDDRVSDREDLRLKFDWYHNFETVIANTSIDFLRQDLFSSEFREASLDPDEIPGGADSGSGFAGIDSRGFARSYQGIVERALSQVDRNTGAIDRHFLRRDN